jgi:hypothetical protein
MAGTAPVLTATPNKQSYQQGEPVVVTVAVQDAPMDVVTTRTQRIVGHDLEGNSATVDIAITVHTPTPDSFTIDSATWLDTSTPAQVNGLQTSSVA